MLTYEYLKNQGNEMLFAYYPDGDKNAPGKIAITEKGEGRIIEESAEDIGKRYAYHAIDEIDPKQKTGTVAWY